MGAKEATSSSKVATSDEKVASPTFPIHGSDISRSNGVARSFRRHSQVVASEKEEPGSKMLRRSYGRVRRIQEDK